jgi:hypothetical protein
MNSASKISGTRFMFKDVIPDKNVTVAQPVTLEQGSSQADSVNAARKKMIERHRNAWKKGQNNG